LTCTGCRSPRAGFLKLNGRVYEALTARLRRGPTRDLYHSARLVGVPSETFVIEQPPVDNRSAN
jgi:hypothetical protein